MPRFLLKPGVVEAHQWTGSLAALPLDFAAAVELRGQRDPLVHTWGGTQTLMEMSWLVREVDGRFEVLPNGAFENRYDPIAADTSALHRETLTLKGKRA